MRTLPYILDMLISHDGRLLHQLNAVDDQADARPQMEILCCMRAILYCHIFPDHRHGPFPFSLTDISLSNIFVDDQWHVQSLIDLDRTMTTSREFLQPPYWITGQAEDELEEGNLTNLKLDGMNLCLYFRIRSTCCSHNTTTQ